MEIACEGRYFLKFVIKHPHELKANYIEVTCDFMIFILFEPIIETLLLPPSGIP